MADLTRRPDRFPILVQWLVPVLSVPGRFIFYKVFFGVFLRNHRPIAPVVSLVIDTILFVIVPLAPSIIYRRQRSRGATNLAIVIACASIWLNQLFFRFALAFLGDPFGRG